MRHRTLLKLLAVLATFVVLAAACGDGDNDKDKVSTETTKAGAGGGGAAEVGGELIDLATFSAAAPQHIDPALNSELDAYQVVNALYDGLTEIDYTDRDNPVVKGLVAKSFKSNADATEWTFTIKDGLTFSNGEPVLPSSFVRGWERASDPALAGDYSYLFAFVDGGQERLDGDAETISGVTADDEAMTLVVKMDKPYANFDAVAGFQIFFPMPKAVDDLADQSQWENGIMIGNGPYKMEKARTDQEIVVVRNDKWGGDIFGHKKATLDRIVFKVGKDVDSAYNAFEAGEGDTANIAPGRVKEADDNYATTDNLSIISSYHFDINMDDPVVGGDDNVLLRKAISMAIDREEINDAVYEGTRSTSTGITPPGVPGFKKDLCDYCAYDVEAAKKAFADWKAAGNKLSGPIKIQLNADAGHEPVVQIMVDNLKEIGITAQAQPIDSTTYFSQLRDGACQICRAGWYADYPTYDNFMFDLFHQSSIGGNNLGPYKNDEFDKLVDEAKATPDKAAAYKLYNQAEDILVNQDVGVIPINWYRGDYVYNPDKVTNFPQNALGLVSWEQVTVKH